MNKHNLRTRHAPTDMSAIDCSLHTVQTSSQSQCGWPQLLRRTIINAILLYLRYFTLCLFSKVNFKVLVEELLTSESLVVVKYMMKKITVDVNINKVVIQRHKNI